MIGSRFWLGGMAILVLAVVVLGYLYVDARENAREAASEARKAEAVATHYQESERRAAALVETLTGALSYREAEYQKSKAALTDARRTLEQIRAAAREETADESLACAVRPVPDTVDHLLRGAAYAD